MGIQPAVEAGNPLGATNGDGTTCNGPSTGEIRQRLEKKVLEMIRNSENGVVQSPTSSGKTHIASTTRWQDHPEITGNQPVILLSGTTDARDDAISKSADSKSRYETLYGRNGICPLARGDYDSDDEAEDTAISAPDGSKPSEWFNMMCEQRGLHLSVAHGIFDRAHDNDLPCSVNSQECPSKTQWKNIPRDDNGEFDYDVLHTTHAFAQVPQLVEDCNLIIDERPDFSLDISTDRLESIVTSYLKEIDAPVKSWEYLITDLTRDELPEGFGSSLTEPDTKWFKTANDAHALAPGIVKAIVGAEKRNHDRWVGSTQYTYPSLNPAHDEMDQEVTIRIVLDDDYNKRILQTIPDLSKARCVVGFDAYPTLPMWKGNTLLPIEIEKIVDDGELHNWRQNYRNQKIVQIGNNKNSWTNQDFNHDKVSILCTELRRKHSEEFRTGIAPSNFEDDFVDILRDSGVEDYDTIHFGNEKSVEDFDSESVGVVAGCISPSSDLTKDWLALLDNDANPKREIDDDYQGQEWVGEDSDVAEEILADVREKGVLQACGRYARSPQQSSEGATIYVLTNVLPEAYVDEMIPDVDGFAPKEKFILDYISSSPDGATPREIYENTDAGDGHVYKTLRKYRSYPWIQVEESSGENQPDVFFIDRLPAGIVEV